MRRVLIVAYYFPPLGGMGSMRTAGFAKHLPSHGWEPTVLTPRSGAYARDPGFPFPEDQVVRSASLEISRTAKRVLRTGGDDVVAAQVGPLGRVLRDLARSTVYYPDAQIGWYLPAVRAGGRLVQDTRFDAVLSSSAPITAHLIARRLARSANLPWVADFRDPWSTYLPSGSSRTQRAARLERGLARSASSVVMTSPYWAAIHAERWGRAVEVITNGYEASAREEPDGEAEGLVLGYLGSFYPGRQNLSGVWDALALLGRQSGLHVDRVRFIGIEPPAVRSELRTRGLEGLLEVTGFLSYAEATSLARRSSVLLLAGPARAAGLGRGEIPGKLFEYLAARKPIVYVGDTECDAADLLRGRPGCYVLAADDVAGIARALEQAAQAPRVERDAGAYTRDALTAKLSRLLDDAQRVSQGGSRRAAGDVSRTTTDPA